MVLVHIVLLWGGGLGENTSHPAPTTFLLSPLPLEYAGRWRWGYLMCPSYEYPSGWARTGAWPWMAQQWRRSEGSRLEAPSAGGGAWCGTLVGGFGKVSVNCSYGGFPCASSMTSVVPVARIKELDGEPSGLHPTNSSNLLVVDHPRSGYWQLLNYSADSFHGYAMVLLDRYCMVSSHAHPQLLACGASRECVATLCFP
jgi:hypothetical protein